MKIYFFFFSFYLAACFVYGQEEHKKIAPDRPGFGDAVSVMHKKQLQIETGVWFERDRTDSVTTDGFDLNTTLFRFGIIKRIEIRFDYNLWESKTYVRNTASQSQTGFYPCRLGMKALLVKNKKLIPEITFVGMEEMPFSASGNFKPDKPNSDLQLSFCNQVTDMFSICYNLGSVRNGFEPHPRNYWALAAEFSFSEKIGYYVQGHGTWQQIKIDTKTATQNFVYAESGIMYYPTLNTQIDLSGGFKFAEYDPEIVSTKKHSYYFFTLGFSWKIVKKKTSAP